ncbi:MAG: hypothetical protein KDD47_06855 [Acidobacteria bacterium]|nr:hypothetical protein [Acidobacteriota bacterium]
MRYFKSLALILTALGGLLSPSVLSAQTTVEWAIVGLDCIPPSGVQAFGCGTFGHLLVGPLEDLECAYDGLAIEDIQVYPHPNKIRYVGTVALPPSGPITPLVDAKQLGTLPQQPPPPPPPPDDPPEEPGVPCSEGSCFSAVGSAQGSWLAVMDWNNWHGWTIGATIRLISNRPVSLFALDDPALTQALGTTIGDHHVMASLCSLAEQIEHEALDEPAVLNLSFGRMAQTSEDLPFQHCDRNTISCQVKRLLAHLKGLGITIVGSAGNHGSMLFPAIAESVLAAGSLDMAAFRWGQEVKPTWESPEETAALLPGYALCLEYLEGTSAGELWPAPAGSSYSSAVLSGWFADGVIDESFPDPLPGIISPEWSSDLACYVLSQDRNPRCNAAANTLLQQLLGQTSLNCWNQSITEPYLQIQGPTVPLDAGLDLPSIEEWISTAQNPAPSSDFCVPCVSGGGWDLVGPGGEKPEGLGAQVAGAQAGGSSFILDVSASGTLSGGHSLDALYLRIEDQFFPLLERSEGQGPLLDDLMNGSYSRLVLDNFVSLIPSRDTQLSLVYVLSPDGSSSSYWTSTPVLLSAPAGRSLSGPF